jgi:hypothetical protein
MPLFIGPRLTEDILLLEGITRSGKFLLGNLLQELEGVEHYQYAGILEHLPILERMGAIDAQTSQALIKSQVDNLVYDQLVGRNLNFRKVDKSSIHNVSEPARYLARVDDPSDADAMDRLRQRDCFPFIAHETLPNIRVYLDSYPALRVVHVARNPLDLVFAWHRRGLGQRWGRDPKLFALAFTGPDGPIPWFATEWADDYCRYPEIDRVIRSILWLSRENQESHARLGDAEKRRIAVTSYEALLTRPVAEVVRLGEFLGRPVGARLSWVVEKERLPAPHPRTTRPERLQIIHGLGNRALVDELVHASDEYESDEDQAWGSNGD